MTNLLCLPRLLHPRPLLPAVPQVSRVEPREQAEEEKRLVARFGDMESCQPDFLDEAGKSIIERIATFEKL